MSRNLIALQNRFLGRGDTVYDRLAALRAAQGVISPEDIAGLARDLSLPRAHVRSVADFYDELKPGEQTPVSVRVCNGEACTGAGTHAYRQRLGNALREIDGVGFGDVTCVGYCGSGPNALIEAGGETRVVSIATDGVAETVAAAARRRTAPDLPELMNTVHPPQNPDVAVLTRYFCDGDAADLAAAERVGAYDALRAALERNPDDVTEAVDHARLRGRGGAGFPCGRKLATVRDAPSADGTRAVVVNADEGDAGAYIDKELLERAPHTVIEGTILAGYAVGATEGHVYLRGEYPRAHRIFGRAVEAARAAGWLGDDVGGTGWAFDLRIVRGHGAYVCGEETSLLRSLEGVPAQVSPKPPYPAVSGLRGAPTLVQNVETLANLPFIVADGGAAFAALGHGDSRGTKLVSLNTAVARPGLYEVELGTSLRTVIFDLAGGVVDGRTFQAVQVGGPLGGIFGKRHLDLPLDFDAMAAAGGLLGHGGMVVYTSADDLVAVGRGLMRFCAIESCGRCFPCRLGSVRGTELLDRMLAGSGTQADLDLLAELSETMRLTSLCALGGGVPVPIDNLLAWFPESFARHVSGARVPDRLADLAARGRGGDA